MREWWLNRQIFLLFICLHVPAKIPCLSFRIIFIINTKTHRKSYPPLGSPFTPAGLPLSLSKCSYTVVFSAGQFRGFVYRTFPDRYQFCIVGLLVSPKSNLLPLTELREEKLPRVFGRVRNRMNPRPVRPYGTYSLRASFRTDGRHLADVGINTFIPWTSLFSNHKIHNLWYRVMTHDIVHHPVPCEHWSNITYKFNRVFFSIQSFLAFFRCIVSQS